jgi:hypothetical protein
VLVERFYRYRGHAIRSLSDDVGIPRKQHGDVLLVSITSLLLADVSGFERPAGMCADLLLAPRSSRCPRRTGAGT